MRRPANHRRGVATVEFAICAPILFLFFFAALEFSRANSIRQTVANASYEGARRGIVPGASVDDVKAATSGFLDMTMVSGAKIEVKPKDITSDTAEVTVKVSVPLNANAWIMPFFLKGETLVGSTTLERERDDSVAVP